MSHVVLKQILENSGRFDVDFVISPEQGKDMSGFVLDFSPYQLVVLDYNGDSWPEETNRRFLEYVQNGGGVVIYHAADNAFSKWPEFNRICALGGWEGRNENSGPYVYWKDGKLVKDSSAGPGGSHGRQHEYVLNGRDKVHPVVKGLPLKWRHAKDELYDRSGDRAISGIFCTRPIRIRKQTVPVVKNRWYLRSITGMLASSIRCLAMPVLLRKII